MQQSKQETIILDEIQEITDEEEAELLVVEDDLSIQVRQADQTVEPSQHDK